MAQKYDALAVAAKLASIELIGGSTETDDLLFAVCRDCDQIIVTTVQGEARGDEMFFEILAHDCRDVTVSEIGIVRDDETEDETVSGTSSAGSWVDETHWQHATIIPEPTDEVMSVLLSEIAAYLEDQS